jgi:hypothetical protein
MNEKQINILVFLAMTEPESTSSEIEERSANVSDVDANTVCYSGMHVQIMRITFTLDKVTDS